MILHQAMQACIQCSHVQHVAWVDEDEPPRICCPNHPHSTMNKIRTIDTELDEHNLVP